MNLSILGAAGVGAATLLSTCAPQGCAPAGPAPDAPGIVAPAAEAPASDCHPDYVECLAIVADLDCGEIGQVIHLYDPRNDAYDIDGRGDLVDDGIACETL